MTMNKPKSGRQVIISDDLEEFHSQPTSKEIPYWRRIDPLKETHRATKPIPSSKPRTSKSPKVSSRKRGDGNSCSRKPKSARTFKAPPKPRSQKRGLSKSLHTRSTIRPSPADDSKQKSRSEELKKSRSNPRRCKSDNVKQTSNRRVNGVPKPRESRAPPPKPKSMKVKSKAHLMEAAENEKVVVEWQRTAPQNSKQATESQQIQQMDDDSSYMELTVSTAGDSRHETYISFDEHTLNDDDDYDITLVPTKPEVRQKQPEQQRPKTQKSTESTAPKPQSKPQPKPKPKLKPKPEQQRQTPKKSTGSPVSRTKRPKSSRVLPLPSEPTEDNMQIVDWKRTSPSQEGLQKKQQTQTKKQQTHPEPQKPKQKSRESTGSTPPKTRCPKSNRALSYSASGQLVVNTPQSPDPNEEGQEVMDWKRSSPKQQSQEQKSKNNKQFPLPKNSARSNNKARHHRSFKSNRTLARISSKADSASCRNLLLRISKMNNDRLSKLKESKPTCSLDLSRSTRSTDHSLTDNDTSHSTTSDGKVLDESSLLSKDSMSCSLKNSCHKTEGVRRRGLPRTRSAPLTNMGKSLYNSKIFRSATSNHGADSSKNKVTQGQAVAAKKAPESNPGKKKPGSVRLFEGLLRGGKGSSKNENTTEEDEIVKRKKASKYEMLASMHSIDDELTMDQNDKEDGSDDENSFAGDGDADEDVADKDEPELSKFISNENNTEFSDSMASEMMSTMSFLHDETQDPPDKPTEVRKGRRNQGNNTKGGNMKLSDHMNREKHSGIPAIEEQSQSDDIFSMADFSKFVLPSGTPSESAPAQSSGAKASDTGECLQIDFSQVNQNGSGDVYVRSQKLGKSADKNRHTIAAPIRAA